MLASTEMVTVSPGAPETLVTVMVGSSAALTLVSPMPRSRHRTRTREVSLWESRLISMITPSFNDNNGGRQRGKIRLVCDEPAPANPISKARWDLP